MGKTAAADAIDLSESVCEMLPAVRKWCRGRCGDFHLAEDVALAALTRRESLKDPRCLRGWLFRIAQRRLADAGRERRRTAPLLVDPPDPCSEPGASPNRPEHVRERLLELMRSLPLKLRRTVRQHYIEGRSIGEIARRLRMSRSGVKSRLHRARTLMRKAAEGTLPPPKRKKRRRRNKRS